MPDKHAESLSNSAKVAFKEVEKQLLQTLTVDNGKEFAAFKALERELGIDIYFARPYTSTDRAINENTNGLIRQYLPQGIDFTTITQKQLNHILDRLNNRPRKKLGSRTPREALEEARLALEVRIHQDLFPCHRVSERRVSTSGFYGQIQPVTSHRDKYCN